jgi:hypothetical protein
MSEIEFVDGLLVKAPPDGAPDFLKCRISIKREELAAWLAKRDGEWINLDVKESKGGKWYAAVNNWKREEKPKGKPAAASGDSDFVDDPLPF